MAIAITKPLKENIADTIKEINEMTERFILDKYPQHKQNNLLAKYNRLTINNQQLSKEVGGIIAAWDWIEQRVILSNAYTSKAKTALSAKELQTIKKTFISELKP